MTQRASSWWRTIQHLRKRPPRLCLYPSWLFNEISEKLIKIIHSWLKSVNTRSWDRRGRIEYWCLRLYGPGPKQLILDPSENRTAKRNPVTPTPRNINIQSVYHLERKVGSSRSVILSEEDFNLYQKRHNRQMEIFGRSYTCKRSVTSRMHLKMLMVVRYVMFLIWLTYIWSFFEIKW